MGCRRDDGASCPQSSLAGAMPGIGDSRRSGLAKIPFCIPRCLRQPHGRRLLGADGIRGFCVHRAEGARPAFGRRGAGFRVRDRIFAAVSSAMDQCDSRDNAGPSCAGYWLPVVGFGCLCRGRGLWLAVRCGIKKGARAASPPSCVVASGEQPSSANYADPLSQVRRQTPPLGEIYRPIKGGRFAAAGASGRIRKSAKLIVIACRIHYLWGSFDRFSSAY